MARPVWFVRLLKKMFPQGGYLALLTRLPIIRKIAASAVMHDKLIFLSSDKVIPVNQAVTKTEDMILPSKVVEHFVEKAKYRWIMNFCICREGMHCEHYPRTLGCLFMGDAVLQINPKFGRLASKEEALEHVKKCREAGLIHTIGRNLLDAAWLGVKPGHKLLTVCNCCECCCVARYFQKTTPAVKATAVKLPGALVRVTDRCKGCGLCTKNVCIFGAIQLVNKRARINAAECRACGRCVIKCPNKAIELILDDKAFMQKTIDQIDTLVDIV